jgi:hypothetical protein
MTDWNCEPSCSRLTRWLTGVLALKNASQLVAIAFVVAVLPAAEDDDVAGADDVAAGADVLAGALGLLLHAAAVAASPASAMPPSTCEKCR